MGKAKVAAKAAAPDTKAGKKAKQAAVKAETKKKVLVENSLTCARLRRDATPRCLTQSAVRSNCGALTRRRDKDLSSLTT